jgi:hypothetical protein
MVVNQLILEITMLVLKKELIQRSLKLLVLIMVLEVVHILLNQIKFGRKKPSLVFFLIVVNIMDRQDPLLSV